ncbi:MAG: chloride channel protein [Pseudomonas sp.]
MPTPQPPHSAAQPLPVAPSLASSFGANLPYRNRPLDRRILRIATIAIALGALAALVAKLLLALIDLATNLAFHGHLSLAPADPAPHALGAWVIVVPVIGGLIVGIMARWGSAAIRGHGIPEAMEQVLVNESRIPARMTWLKPLSSAVAIGSGGPFGAEGPIIATGGALGSLFGQRLRVSADERKVLLAAGAAAGMAAIFSAPVSAVLLAIELLLFERRARSLIPVALATTTAAGLRMLLLGSGPVFAMPAVTAPGLAALASYALLGGVVGIASIAVTRAVYAIEDGFARLPLHWMWWPALGGIAVGVVGYLVPATLGVGYRNIEAMISGHMLLGTMLLLCLAKFVSWSIALGSGTSGGTLAPLFTIGGALGGAAGMALAGLFPALEIDPGVAALVGMAAMFAGASRAFMTSVVFAFEATQQPHALLPLLGACAMAYLVSGLLMRHTIMSEKIERRGVRVPSDYADDYLDRVRVGQACSREVVSLPAGQSLAATLDWLASGDSRAHHEGFPVLDDDRRLLGLITRRQLLAPGLEPTTPLARLVRPDPPVVGEHHSLREAADHMLTHELDLLAVVAEDDPRRVVGVITRIDLLAAHRRRLREAVPG